jgi:hypothetical protein
MVNKRKARYLFIEPILHFEIAFKINQKKRKLK